MTDLKEPIYGYQWRCVPGCDFANHELRQRCRNCGTPRSLAAFIDYYRPAVFFVTDLIARLTALRGECEQRPICEDYAYQAIRHINRNCDMQCESHADGSECVEWARYDGTALAVLWNEWPAILHALKVQEAAEAWVEARQTIDEQPLRWALVRAVKGEQG